MTVSEGLAPAARRTPVQARSRQTVIRILDAAAAIADEQGVEPLPVGAQQVGRRPVPDRQDPLAGDDPGGHRGPDVLYT